ncbi:MAG: hypothetical protein ACJ763_06720 [Bdellovibrionia bacterium]
MASFLREISLMLIAGVTAGVAAQADPLRSEDSLAVVHGALQLSSQISKTGAATAECGVASASSLKTQQCRINDEKAQVIHVPMRHYRPETESSKTVTRAIAESQLRITQFLLTHPKAEVFEEGTAIDGSTWLGRWMQRMSDAPNFKCSGDTLKAAFPRGVPKQMDETSEAQQALLAFCGGPRLLEAFGRLKQIHQGEDAWLNIKMNQKLEPKLQSNPDDPRVFSDPELRSLAFDQREKFLVKKVREYLAEHPKAQAVILFGKTHDFAKYFSDLRFARAEGCVPMDPSAPSFQALGHAPGSLNGTFMRNVQPRR